MPVQRAVCDAISQEACSGNSDFTQLETEITRFEGVAFFCLLRFIVTNTLKIVQLMRVPGPNRRSSVMPVQRAVCDAGSQEACLRNSDFTQHQTEITRFEGVAFFCLLRFIVTNTLKNVQLMRVPGPNRRPSVMPVQIAVHDAGSQGACSLVAIFP